MQRTQLLLDPWSADYPGSVQAGGTESEEGSYQIDARAEMGEWRALAPGQPPESAAFVDGVRRLEARVVGFGDEGVVHGLFASFAAGAAVVRSARAEFAQCTVARRLVLSGARLRTEQFRIGNCELSFEGLASPEEGPEALVLALQGAMREAEQRLARDLDADMVFLDGPIAFTSDAPGPIVGVVKTIHRLYLGPDGMDLLLNLRTGERTPVFAISEGRKTRYSWYLRIADRRPIHHAFSGVIRLEASAAGGIEAATKLAGKSAAFLPQFASAANRDPRAPQNLTPVGALEDFLRNQMGNWRLIQRAVEERIGEGLTI